MSNILKLTPTLFDRDIVFYLFGALARPLMGEDWFLRVVFVSLLTLFFQSLPRPHLDSTPDSYRTPQKATSRPVPTHINTKNQCPSHDETWAPEFDTPSPVDETYGPDCDTPSPVDEIYGPQNDSPVLSDPEVSMARQVSADSPVPAEVFQDVEWIEDSSLVRSVMVGFVAPDWTGATSAFSAARRSLVGLVSPKQQSPGTKVARWSLSDEFGSSSSESSSNGNSYDANAAGLDSSSPPILSSPNSSVSEGQGQITLKVANPGSMSSEEGLSPNTSTNF